MGFSFKAFLKGFALEGIILVIGTIPVLADHSDLHVEDEIIIKFNGVSQPGEEDIMRIFADQHGFRALEDKLTIEENLAVLNSYPWANLHHVRVTNGRPLEEVMGEIRSWPEVEYVEPNYFFALEATTESFDYQDAGMQSSSSDSVSSEFASSDVESSGAQVTVAVIDTGVDYTHPDIAAHMWVNSGEIPGDGKDNDGNGYVDDINGWDFVNNDKDPYDDHYHGTHVAGITLGLQDKFNPVIKIMALKFLDRNGFGTSGNAIKSIDYAIKNGAKVLNNSWGGGSFSFALRDAIVASYNANRVFVVAAGNSSLNIDERASYPPSYLVPNMVSVAALDSNDNLAYFSNYGPKTVHVGAAGVSIYSSVPKERCGAPPCYSYLSGTSMAAPYVSGLAAMMLSKNPELQHLQVKSIIMDTSVSNASLQGMIGKGSVDSDDAVVTASNTTPDSNIPPYSPSSVAGSAGLTAGQLASMGCGSITDITNNDSFNSSSGMSLFFLAWPLLFILVLKILLNKRRKFSFYPF